MTHDLSDSRLEEMARETVQSWNQETQKIMDRGYTLNHGFLELCIVQALKSVRDAGNATNQYSNGFVDGQNSIIARYANVKAVVVEDVGEEELKEMARKFAPLDEYPNTDWRREGFRSGFKAAMKRMRGEEV